MSLRGNSEPGRGERIELREGGTQLRDRIRARSGAARAGDADKDAGEDPWSVLRVWVGSTSSEKLEAVRLGLQPFFAEIEIKGAAVPSGVPEQPIGLAEIIAGASQRARAAHAAAAGGADLGAGIEDGLVPVAELPGGYANIGCCVLYDGATETLGFSAGFEYPPACVQEAVGPPRRPIGGLFDAAFAQVRAAHPLLEDPGASGGNVGRLTGGRLTRAQYGAQAVTCALVRRLHPELYALERGVTS
jgi:inosine/xanthosine triphosphatase